MFLFSGLCALALTSRSAYCAAGDSLDIRKAAAEQVASIAQTHPAQLPSLLRRVSSNDIEHKCKPYRDSYTYIALQFVLKLTVQLAAYLQIHSCLRHTQWDTRVAASTCLGLMAAHFTHHSVITLAEAAEPATAASPAKVEELVAASAMSFQNFDISQVLQQGTALVASGGKVCPVALHRLQFLCKGYSNVMFSC